MSLELKMELYVMAKNMICMFDDPCNLWMDYVINKIINGNKHKITSTK